MFLFNSAIGNRQFVESRGIQRHNMVETGIRITRLNNPVVLLFVCDKKTFASGVGDSGELLYREEKSIDELIVVALAGLTS